MKVRFRVPELAAVPAEERAALVRRCLKSPERQAYGVKVVLLAIAGFVVLLVAGVTLSPHWLVYDVCLVVYLVAAFVLAIRGQISLMRQLILRQLAERCPERVDPKPLEGDNT